VLMFPSFEALFGHSRSKSYSWRNAAESDVM
jgi:hypothetical protein